MKYKKFNKYWKDFYTNFSKYVCFLGDKQTWENQNTPMWYELYPKINFKKIVLSTNFDSIYN